MQRKPLHANKAYVPTCKHRLLHLNIVSRLKEEMDSITYNVFGFAFPASKRAFVVEKRKFALLTNYLDWC